MWPTRRLLVALALLLLVAVPIGMATIFAAGGATPRFFFWPFTWGIFLFWRFAMPWLIFGPLVWAMFAVWRGPRREQWSPQGLDPRPAPGAPAPSPSQPQPQPLPRLAGEAELPIDVQVKVEQIRRKVEVLLTFASRFPPFSRDLYVVRETASAYLPRTIKAYLAVPPGDGDRVLTSSGKTALAELKAQLDLLDAKLNEIVEDLQRQDLERFLINRRFLDDRFGSAST